MPVEYFVPMVTGDFSKRPPMGKVETRQIFLSHAHADRELALGFRKMLEEAFSGLLTVFISSDPTPTGCLMPGEEWYREIHTHLADSETILVLATLVSIERPWIYWEAGIGKATCPGGVIVVRVGLTTREVLSPVSNFQSYDGTIQGDGGLGELIGKIASQLGMVLSPILVDALAKQWSEVALNHRAEEGKSGAEETRLEREQLNDFGALVARLESTVDSLRNGVLTESTRVSTELVTMVSISDLDSSGLHSIGEVVSKLSKLPEDPFLELTGWDADGDPRCVVISKDDAASFFIRREVIERLTPGVIGHVGNEKVRAFLEDLYRRIFEGQGAEEEEEFTFE